MSNLSIDFAGMRFPNPFMLASAPPARTAEMIKRAFAAGWGGAVTKTIGLEPAQDLQPRLQPLHYHKRNVGMENIELISQLTVEEWQVEIAEVKSAYPDRPLWASIMASLVKEDWQRLVEAVQEAGPDAFNSTSPARTACPTRAWGHLSARTPS
jgi:dihydropyrimidine dehydrogenase (NAD+) subunit PreA